MANTIQMTQTGYDELVKELEELKTVKRSEIAEKIKVARGYGDLSENSEYDAAKNEQAEIEARYGSWIRIWKRRASTSSWALWK